MTDTAFVRRRSDAWAAAATAAGVALAAWAVADGTVGSFERSAFRFVNGWTDALQPVLYVFQLLGVIGMPLAPAVVALALRAWRLGLGLLLLIPAKLLLEKDVLKALVRRERPGTTIPGADLRDVPSAGPSFPSGHAIIVFGIVSLLAPYLRRRWQLLLVVALAVLNSVARVYLGAHAPLDVIGGALTGVMLGALLNLGLGVPSGTGRSGVPLPGCGSGPGPTP